MRAPTLRKSEEMSCITASGLSVLMDKAEKRKEFII